MIIQSNNSQVLQKETSGLLLVRGERTGKEGIREGIRVQSLLHWDQEKTCSNT